MQLWGWNSARLRAGAVNPSSGYETCLKVVPKAEGKENWAENSLLSASAYGGRGEGEEQGEHSEKGRGKCQRWEKTPGTARTCISCPFLPAGGEYKQGSGVHKGTKTPWTAGCREALGPCLMEQPFAGNTKGEEIQVQRPHPNPIFWSIRIG